MSRPKPCPVCRDYRPYVCEYYGKYWVRCGNCLAVGAFAPTYSRAIKAWNRDDIKKNQGGNDEQS